MGHNLDGAIAIGLVWLLCMYPVPGAGISNLAHRQLRFGAVDPFTNWFRGLQQTQQLTDADEVYYRQYYDSYYGSNPRKEERRQLEENSSYYRAWAFAEDSPPQSKVKELEPAPLEADEPQSHALPAFPALPDRFKSNTNSPFQPVPNRPNQSGFALAFPKRIVPLPAPDPFGSRANTDADPAGVFIDSTGLFQESPVNYSLLNSINGKNGDRRDAVKQIPVDASAAKLEHIGSQTLFDGQPVFTD